MEQKLKRHKIFSLVCFSLRLTKLHEMIIVKVICQWPSCVFQCTPFYQGNQSTKFSPFYSNANINQSGQFQHIQILPRMKIIWMSNRIWNTHSEERLNLFWSQQILGSGSNILPRDKTFSSISLIEISLSLSFFL